tara:strand:+ start:277 stop:462 length:186 start_codon:yes stop_codon:yes gene_type:complete
MEFHQDNIDIAQDIVDKNKRIINSQNIENLNYLYPNGHRVTNQMRWFKGSKDRGLSSDMAA